MKERGILMSAPMVIASIEGRKTNTRRTVKKLGCQCGTWIPKEMDATTPEGFQTAGHSGRWWCECCTSEQDAVNCPYGIPGDHLWVKETWQPEGVAGYERLFPIRYRATQDERVMGHRWRPSIFMPRWASRITLEIESVRVERLQSITDQDAIAEGIEGPFDGPIDANDGKPWQFWRDYSAQNNWCTPVGSYKSLWESINGVGSWDRNDWVWRLEFRVVAGLRTKTAATAGVRGAAAATQSA